MKFTSLAVLAVVAIGMSPNPFVSIQAQVVGQKKYQAVIDRFTHAEPMAQEALAFAKLAAQKKLPIVEQESRTKEIHQGLKALLKKLNNQNSLPPIYVSDIRHVNDSAIAKSFKANRSRWIATSARPEAKVFVVGSRARVYAPDEKQATLALLRQITFQHLGDARVSQKVGAAAYRVWEQLSETDPDFLERSTAKRVKALKNINPIPRPKSPAYSCKCEFFEEGPNYEPIGLRVAYGQTPSEAIQKGCRLKGAAKVTLLKCYQSTNQRASAGFQYAALFLKNESTVVPRHCQDTPSGDARVRFALLTTLAKQEKPHHYQQFARAYQNATGIAYERNQSAATQRKVAQKIQELRQFQQRQQERAIHRQRQQRQLEQERRQLAYEAQQRAAIEADYRLHQEFENWKNAIIQRGIAMGEPEKFRRKNSTSGAGRHVEFPIAMRNGFGSSSPYAEWGSRARLWADPWGNWHPLPAKFQSMMH